MQVKVMVLLSGCWSFAPNLSELVGSIFVFQGFEECRLQ